MINTNFKGCTPKILRQCIKQYESTEIKYFDSRTRNEYYKIHWLRKELHEQTGKIR